VVAKTGNQPSQIQVNLSKNSTHAKKYAEMEALLLSEMKRLDDPYRFWNQPQED
jgi:hypothetical protein